MGACRRRHGMDGIAVFRRWDGKNVPRFFILQRLALIPAKIILSIYISVRVSVPRYLLQPM